MSKIIFRFVTFLEVWRWGGVKVCAFGVLYVVLQFPKVTTKSLFMSPMCKHISDFLFSWVPEQAVGVVILTTVPPIK